MTSAPVEFSNVTALAKANIYFDGKVVSHTIRLADGSKKTLGLIFPGSYNFSTGLPERMELVAGACRYRLKGSETWAEATAGEHFDVPGDSAFDVAVDGGICEYICSFID
jgi:purine/pyrimidine-nucleoside phosphorylase